MSKRLVVHPVGKGSQRAVRVEMRQDRKGDSRVLGTCMHLHLTETTAAVCRDRLLSLRDDAMVNLMMPV